MTATVDKFCQLNGIDKNREDLTEVLYQALIGGGENKLTYRPENSGEEIEAAISNCNEEKIY